MDPVPHMWTPGEFPPLLPKTFFVHDELIKKVVCLIESHHPIALVGTGGIGTTSTTLTVLCHGKIWQQFNYEH